MSPAFPIQRTVQRRALKSSFCYNPSTTGGIGMKFTLKFIKEILFCNDNQCILCILDNFLINCLNNIIL